MNAACKSHSSCKSLLQSRSLYHLGDRRVLLFLRLFFSLVFLGLFCMLFFSFFLDLFCRLFFCFLCFYRLFCLRRNFCRFYCLFYSLFCSLFRSLFFRFFCRLFRSLLCRARSAVILLLLQRCQRFILHLQLHRLVDILSFTEPEDQIVTFFQTLCGHSRLMITLCQLIRPLFYILRLLKLFQRGDLLGKRRSLCSEDLIF